MSDADASGTASAGAKQGPPDPRAAQAERKRARTRGRLLQATFTLLGRPEGWNTQIEAIVKQAGMARGTFYNYFDSRSDILDAMAYELNHGLNLAVADAPDAATRTCWAVRAYIRKAERDPHWGRAMVNLSTNGHQPFGEDTHRSAIQTIDDGIVSGEFTISQRQAGLDLVLGTGIHAIQTVCSGYAASTHAEDVTLAVLLGLGVERAQAIALVTAPFPEIDIGRPHLWGAGPGMMNDRGGFVGQSSPS